VPLQREAAHIIGEECGTEANVGYVTCIDFDEAALTSWCSTRPSKKCDVRLRGRRGVARREGPQVVSLSEARPAW
jgi:hypothetical protein